MLDQSWLKTLTPFNNIFSSYQLNYATYEMRNQVFCMYWNLYIYIYIVKGELSNERGFKMRGWED
jgi:hypothetical protein